jgi:hypothetical protein
MSEEARKEFEAAMEARRNTQTIELDCAPGFIRPGHLIEGVIKDTGLELKVTTSRCFGNWTWDYSDVPAEKWKEIQPILKARIEELYHAGRIRYGSW